MSYLLWSSHLSECDRLSLCLVSLPLFVCPLVYAATSAIGNLRKHKEQRAIMNVPDQ